MGFSVCVGSMMAADSICLPILIVSLFTVYASYYFSVRLAIHTASSPAATAISKIFISLLFILVRLLLFQIWFFVRFMLPLYPKSVQRYEEKLK